MYFTGVVEAFTRTLIYRLEADRVQWDESGVCSVREGINREAYFRAEMPKNHDNVNITDHR